MVLILNEVQTLQNKQNDLYQSGKDSDQPLLSVRNYVLRITVQRALPGRLRSDRADAAFDIVSFVMH